MSLPNKLTILRLILIPIFVLFLLLPWDFGTIHTVHTSLPVSQLIACLIFIFASATDYLDGYIARRDHLVSNFGKFADPLADKLLVLTALILLIEMGKVPAWVVAIIVARELSVTGLRTLLVEQGGTVMAAQLPGKIKTVTQMLAIILLLLNDWPVAFLPFSVGKVCLYICLFFTIYSGVDYFYQSRFLFTDLFESE